MESLQKRCNFLEHVIDVLGLSNVRVIRTRAEVCGFLCVCSVIEHMGGLSNHRYFFVIHDERLKLPQDAGQDTAYREVFDVVVARAVAEMRVLGMSLHICKSIM